MVKDLPSDLDICLLLWNLLKWGFLILIIISHLCLSPVRFLSRDFSQTKCIHVSCRHPNPLVIFYVISMWNKQKYQCNQFYGSEAFLKSLYFNSQQQKLNTPKFLLCMYFLPHVVLFKINYSKIFSKRNTQLVIICKCTLHQCKFSKWTIQFILVYANTNANIQRGKK